MSSHWSVSLLMGQERGPDPAGLFQSQCLQAQCQSSHPRAVATPWNLAWGWARLAVPGGPLGRTYSVSESSKSDTAGTTLSTGVHAGLTQARPRCMTACTYLGNNPRQWGGGCSQRCGTLINGNTSRGCRTHPLRVHTRVRRARHLVLVESGGLTTDVAQSRGPTFVIWVPWNTLGNC
jgi:hypothetical protein